MFCFFCTWATVSCRHTNLFYHTQATKCDHKISSYICVVLNFLIVTSLETLLRFKYVCILYNIYSEVCRKHLHCGGVH